MNRPTGPKEDTGLTATSGGSMPGRLRVEYASVTADASLTDGCQLDWVGSDATTCVLLHNDPLSWHQAENRCNQYGGHLVSVVSSAVQQLIDTVITNR